MRKTIMKCICDTLSKPNQISICPRHGLVSMKFGHIQTRVAPDEVKRINILLEDNWTMVNQYIRPSYYGPNSGLAYPFKWWPAIEIAIFEKPRN